MKKTLVALSVLAASNSAFAIELYNKDKVSVNMTGDVEVVYLKPLTDGEDFQQEIQDADFGFDVQYMVNNELSVGAYLEFSADEDDGSNEGNAYVALYSQSYGSIKFGRLDTVLDDAGIGDDYQFGISSFFQNGHPYNMDEALRYDLDTGTFYAALALAQNKDGDVATMGEDGLWVDGKVGARFADFDLTAFFGDLDSDGAMIGGDPVGDQTVVALEARYGGFGNLGLAAGYYYSDVDGDLPGQGKADTFGLAANYALSDWLFAAGYSYSDQDIGGDYNAWYLNAGYGIAPATTIYAEVGGDDADDSQTGYAIGMLVEF
nr:porin [Vibrio hippocampi]